MPQNVGCCSGSTASTEDLQHPLKSAAALGASPQRGYVPVQAGPQRFQSRVGDGPRGPAPSGTAATRTVQLAYNARLVCHDSGFYCTPRDSARFGDFGASRFARFAIRTFLLSSLSAELQRSHVEAAHDSRDLPDAKSKSAHSQHPSERFVMHFSQPQLFC